MNREEALKVIKENRRRLQMGNRVIKFRGKRVDNGEWVYGFVAKINVYECGKDYEETVILRQLKYDDRDYYDQEFIDADAVIPETVGQYTGLKDKNGVEIYEGDIITTDLERNYLIVEYRNGAFMINCNDGLEDYYDIFFSTSEEPQEVWKYGEIIGNIHDWSEELAG